jgi:hypothetical protein
MDNSTQADGTKGNKVYVTLTGLPLSFQLQWPFHKSTSGADFWVLHGDIRLENSAGLHAPVAVNLSATVREVLPSLDPEHAEAGKLVPVHFSSRHYDFKRDKWVFGKASEAEMGLMVARKVYWQTRIAGGAVWLGDPTEALYVETTPSHVLETARKQAREGLMTVEGEWAAANAALMAQRTCLREDEPHLPLSHPQIVAFARARQNSRRPAPCAVHSYYCKS